LAPKALAISVSRTKPVIRDSKVSKETVEADLKRLTRGSVAAPVCHTGAVCYNNRLCQHHPQTLKGNSMASAKPKKKNPRLASGRKRARQDVKLNEANSSLRSKYRTAVKNVEKAVQAGDKTKAAELFGKMQSVVDIIADKKIFHKNKAARDKSRLAAKVKTLALAA
jgi:small subunit ribosomal protein S20